MKVAIEVDPYRRPYSGIKVYFSELVSRFCLYDDIETCGHMFNFAHRANVSGMQQALRIPIMDNPLMSYGLYRRIWHICPLNYQRLFPSDAQITHFFNYIIPPNVSGKIITTIYDLTCLRYPDTMQNRNRVFLQKELQRSANRSNLILTISEFSKGEIVDLLHVPPEKIHVVYPAANESFHVSEEIFASLTRRFGITKPYVLYLGTLEPRKNLTRLVRAFRRLQADGRQGLQLVLAGECGWKSESILRESGGKNDLILTGFVTEEQKSALLAHAAMFTYLSLYEGFGIPILEAMREGIPTICADTAVFREVTGGASLLVNPLCEIEIASAMDAVLSDSMLAYRLGALGPSQAQLFSWDRSAAQLVDIYRSV